MLAAQIQRQPGAEYLAAEESHDRGEDEGVVVEEHKSTHEGSRSAESAPQRAILSLAERAETAVAIAQ